MNTTTPRTELTEMIAMLNEAIAGVEAEGGDATRQREVLAKYEAQLAAMVGEGGVIRIDHTEARNLLARPEGGKAHRNQYGPCQVAYATDKQQAFALALMDRKDTTKLTQGVTALDVVAVREALVARKINKKAISSLIDRLLGCPDKADAPVFQGTPVRVFPASEKQVAFLLRLAAERTPHVTADAITAWAATNGSKAVSAKIDELLAMPKAEVAPVALEVGMYRLTDGKLIRVYLGRQSGNLLAKEVVKTGNKNEDGTEEYTLDYLGLASKYVPATAHRLTLDEAKEWGRMTASCCVCAAHLDDATSIKEGIGPVCKTKF